ncbi:hypothetical protein KXX32_000348, partial [Aspergillus fumigatus]
ARKNVEMELEARDEERKPLMTLQESVPEQAAPSCLEFPGKSVVSQSHHWERRRGKVLIAIHVFLGGSAVDAGNEHGRETGGALLALSGAASGDHGTQFMYISCLLIRFNSIQTSVYLPGLMTTQSETLECSRSAANLTGHELALWECRYSTDEIKGVTSTITFKSLSNGRIYPSITAGSSHAAWMTSFIREYSSVLSFSHRPPFGKTTFRKRFTQETRGL